MSKVRVQLKIEYIWSKKTWKQPFIYSLDSRNKKSLSIEITLKLNKTLNIFISNNDKWMISDNKWNLCDLFKTMVNQRVLTL